MKKLLVFLVTFFCFSNFLFSQTPITPHWQWGNSFDGNVSSIIKEGDYLYVTGKYQNTTMTMTGLTNVGGTDVYVMKIDTLGNVIWAKSIAGTGNEASVRIIQNSAGHLLVAGNFTSSTLTTGSSTLTNLGSSDIFMAEFDANGNVIALTNYGSAGNDVLNDFCIDATGQYYLQKTTGLMTYSPSGTLVWQKSYATGMQIHYSSTDNSVYVSGLFVGTIALGSLSITSEIGYNGAQADVFSIKFDPSGNEIWLKNISNSTLAESNVLSYFDQTTNSFYLAYNFHYNISQDWVFQVYKVSNSYGTALMLRSHGGEMIHSMSAKGNYVSIVNSGYIDMINLSISPSGLYVMDVTNSANDIIYDTYESINKAHLFDGVNSIYGGREMNPSSGNYTIGRYGYKELLAVNQQQSVSVCDNNPALLTGSFTGGNGTIQYVWNPTTGLSSSNTLTTTASLAVGTTMNYTLTATDSMGLVAYNYFTVTAPVPTSPPVIIPSVPMFCSGSMTLSTTSTGTITWYNANYPTQSIGSGQTKTITAPGEYICSLDNNGCAQNDTISILNTVSASITPSATSVCLGQPLTLTASGALNYSWSHNVSNGVSFTPTTTETYTVTATDINGCTDFKTITIPVHSLPVINSVVATPSSLCNQGNSTLTANIAPSATLCTPSCSQTPGATGSAIALFKFGTSINNPSADAPGDYSYYSSLVANVVAGQSYTVEIHSALPFAKYRRIWIDFNGDGDFSDIGETVLSNDITQALFVGSVQIPSLALNGSYRMRVATGSYYPNPCSQQEGEYEDYKVNISGGTDLLTWSPSTFLTSSSGLVALGSNINTNITYTATLHNPYGCTASQSASITVDTVISMTSVTICSTQTPYLWNGQNLTTSGTYASYFTGSQGCDSVAYLNLVVNCCVPTGLSLSVIGYNSATAIWTAGSGSTSFDVRYKAVSDTTWNTISGIIGSSVQLTGLTQCNFAHEFQVRRNCINGMTSAWSSSKLFSLNPPPCAEPFVNSPQILSTSSLVINWTSNSGSISTNLEYRAAGTTTWQSLNSLPGNTVPLTNLNAATTYQYRLKSNCSGGSSCFTSIHTATTPSCFVPYNLSLSYIGQTSATATWTLNSFYTAVDLRYKPVSGTTWTIISGITSTSYTMTNLVSGTQYEFQLDASCGNSNSGFSSSKVFLTLGGCPIPSGLTMSAIGATNATCLWTGLTGFNTYNLRYKAVTSSTWIVINGITTNSYSLTGLAPTTLYEYQVERTCGSGYSSSKQFITQNSCPVPTGLATTYIGTTIAELVWNAIPGLDNYTLRYRIYNTANWTIVSGLTTNSYTLNGLSPNTYYEYQVERSCVSGYSTSKIFFTPACPTTTTGMGVSNLQSNTATCYWNTIGYGTPTNLPTYNFRFKRTSDTAWTTVTNITTTTYNLSNLLPGTEYEYQVYHENCNWTQSILFTTECPEVTQVIITQITSNSALVSWNGIGPNYSLTLNGTGQQTIIVNNITASSYLFTGLVQGTNYYVVIKQNCSSSSSNYSYQNFTTLLSCSLPVPSGLTMSAIGNTSGTCLWTSVAGATSFNLKYRPVGTTTWNIINNVPTNTYALSGLAQQTTYEYQVSANCGSGVTNYSASKQFTTSSSCAIPSGLTLTAWTATTGSTKWNAVSSAISYDLKYKTVSATTWNQVNGITGTNYILTNLSPGTNYEFQVKSNCASGVSVYSPSKYFTTTSTSACSVPTGLTLTSWADNYGATKWTAVAGAISYDVQYKATASSTWNSVSGLTSNSYLISSLTPSTQYEFQVRANCAANNSTYSASKIFTTNALCHSTYDNSTNNTSTGAAAIPLLTPIVGSINSVTDIDYYKFSITNSANLYISLTTLPANYDLTIYNAAMTQVANSANTGNASEYIMLPSPSIGIYYVKVNGVAGANSSTQCYTLKVNNNGTYLKPIDEVPIERETSIEPIVFPNPTNGELNIQFTTKEASNYQVRVLDVAGKQIYASDAQTTLAGEQTHTLRLGDYSIAEGVYIVVTTIGEQRYFQRVVYRK